MADLPYRIVQDQNERALELKVRELMEQGYVPIGGVAVLRYEDQLDGHTYWHHQAMVHYDTLKKLYGHEN